MKTKQAKKITPLAPRLPAPTMPQVAPNSQNLEARILGASLSYPAFAHQMIATIADRKMFFYRSHQMIYEALREVVDGDKEIDIMRLQEVLTRRGQLKEIGGLAAITKLTIDFYASKVGTPDLSGDLTSLKGYYARYQLLLVADTINKQAYNMAIEPTEALQNAQNNLSEVGEYVFSDLFISTAGQAQRHADRTEANEHKKIVYIPTGIRTLDTFITGLQRRKVYVIAGYLNHGKTALSLSIGYNVAKAGNNVIVFNVADGNRADVFSRFVAMEGGISYEGVASNKVATGQYSKYIEGLQVVSAMSNLHIQSEKAMQIDNLEAQARTIAAKAPVDLIVIDYIQRITVDDTSPYNRTTHRAMCHVSQRITKLAEYLDCPIIVAAQINRQGAGKMPQVGHIQEAGNIGQDADMVLLVYKEGLDNAFFQFPNQIEVKIGKNKVNGQFGTALTMVNPQSTYVESQAIRL